MRSRKTQSGVALLAAILLVAVATILAAGIAFKSAMAARRGAASLSFDETVLVAQGAEALAAYFLRADGGDSDNPTEMWANPLMPLEITPGVVLAASVEDLQGRFNLNSLIYNDVETTDSYALEAFQNLLKLVGVEPEWAEKISDWIDKDPQTNGPNGLEDDGTTGESPPYRTANTWITSTSELLALPGFGRERYLKIAPYVAALPPGVPLNICTASPVVLDAMVGPDFRQQSNDDPKNFADLRNQKRCFPDLVSYLETVRLNQSSIPGIDLVKIDAHFDDQSRYFRLTSLVTLGGADFALYSLLQRPAPEGHGPPGKIRVLQRSFTPD
jgi:general secretion pathway protein K